MKGIILEVGVLLAAAGTAASPLKLGIGPVVQADGPMANVQSSVFNPLEGRDKVATNAKQRRASYSKFNVMRRRIEMFLVPFPHGCTTPTEPLPAPSSEQEAESHNATEDRNTHASAQNLELRRRDQRFEHYPMNLAARQVPEVTVTTTTTSQVTADANEAKTVTVTATAIETIGASNGEERNNGTEAIASPIQAPADSEASTTSAAESASTSVAEGEASSASASPSPGAQAPANEQTSATSSSGESASATSEAGASSTPAGENTVVAPETTSSSAANEVASSTTAAASESAGSSTSNAKAGTTSSGFAPGTSQTAGAGVNEFQNADGISVPLEILGDNIPKPESNSMSGLPLTPDPNQPAPTTAGMDLPAPTLSPENGANQGTLLQPDPLPGQGQGPPPPADNPDPPAEGQAPPIDVAPVDTPAPSGTQAQPEGQSPAVEEIASSSPSSNPEAPNTPQDGQGRDITESSNNAGGGTVSQLRPDDIVDMLNAAPPKRVMRRAEIEAWLDIEDKLAARRRDAERSTSAFRTRRARRQKIAL